MDNFIIWKFQITRLISSWILISIHITLLLLAIWWLGIVPLLSMKKPLAPNLQYIYRQIKFCCEETLHAWTVLEYLKLKHQSYFLPVVNNWIQKQNWLMENFITRFLCSLMTGLHRPKRKSNAGRKQELTCSMYGCLVGGSQSFVRLANLWVMTTDSFKRWH